MDLNPSLIRGAWDEGWTLDRHIRSSDFLGYNEYGHAQFDTKRTELGELLYRLKYKADQSAVLPIARVACDFIRGRDFAIDIIVPVPPTKSRRVQPLFQIADELGHLLNLPVDKEGARKTKSTTELKNVDLAQRTEVLAGVHSVEDGVFRGRRVLLFDDLYQSGVTLNTVGLLLKQPGSASAVIALALTRARG